MSGIYGDSLLAFPEQYITLTVYSMTAEVNGGWTRDEDSEQTIQGIYQHTGGKKLTESNGNLARTSSVEFWTATTGLNGMFTTIDSDVFRLSSDNDWHTEGGFVRYGLEKVIGNDGAESDDTTWNIGSDNFS